MARSFILISKMGAKFAFFSREMKKEKIIYYALFCVHHDEAIYHPLFRNKKFMLDEIV